MRKRLKSYACMLFTVLLAACELPLSDDYYQDIPHEENIPMGIDLNALTDGHSILITQATNLNYALSAFGKKINQVWFTMGNKEWELSDQPTGSLSITPEEFPAGRYTLTCNMYVKSNSGSIADQFDNEYYGGSLSWPVLIDYSMEAPQLLVSQITAERQIQLQWAPPVLSHLDIVNYQLDYYRHGSFERSIQIATGETSYIDPLYAGEKGEYYIGVILKDPALSGNLHWPIGSLSLENSISSASSISPTGETIFSWECPYRNKISVQIDGQAIQTTEGQTSVVIPHKAFGSDFWEQRSDISFSVFPYNTTTMSAVYSTEEKTYHYATCLSSYNSYHTWNKTENQLYVLNDQKLRSYQLPGYGLTAEATIASSYLYEICAAPNHATIAVSCGPLVAETGDYIYLFGGKELNQIARISCEGSMFTGSVRNHRVFLTSDHKLVYFLRQGSKTTGIVCNASNGKQEKTFEIDTPSDYWYLTLSEDGKWLVYTLGNQTFVAELDNYEVQSQHAINNSINNEYYFFNPKDIHELGIATSGRISFRNLDTQRDTRTITLPNFADCYSVDPLNGNISSMSGSELYIQNQEGEVLFQVPSSYTYSQLMGNILVNSDGLVLNLTNYLKP